MAATQDNYHITSQGGGETKSLMTPSPYCKCSTEHQLLEAENLSHDTTNTDKESATDCVESYGRQCRRRILCLLLIILAMLMAMGVMASFIYTLYQEKTMLRIYIMAHEGCNLDMVCNSSRSILVVYAFEIQVLIHIARFITIFI